MKPAADLDIFTGRVAPLRHGSGDDVEPLSKLAAGTTDQRAEFFAFTDEDRALFNGVVANGAAAHDRERRSR